MLVDIADKRDMDEFNMTIQSFIRPPFAELYLGWEHAEDEAQLIGRSVGRTL